MGPEETTIEQSKSVEDLHSLRLRALLHELVRKHGPKGAAKALEIDHRTLLASMEERDLSRRVRVALEKALLSEAGAAADRQRERTDALEQRVEARAKETRGSFAAVGGEIRAQREAHAQGMRQFERRLAAAEAGRRDQGSVPDAGRTPVVGVRERRLHPRTGDPRAGSRRRGRVRAGVAAHRRVAQAAGRPPRQGQRRVVAGAGGAHPGVGGGHAE